MLPQSGNPNPGAKLDQVGHQIMRSSQLYAKILAGKLLVWKEEGPK